MAIADTIQMDGQPMGPATRQARREEFLRTYFKDQPVQVIPLQGDASFRRYYRVIGADKPYMLMEDSPDRPPVPPFVMVEPFRDIAQHLRRIGLNAPRIHAENIDHGLLLLDDFGENTYTRLLNSGADAKPLYELAIDVLIHLHNQQDRCDVNVPNYDIATYLQETHLFIDWYIPAVTGRSLNEEARREWDQVWTEILSGLPQDQKTLVLRDYHVDNMMLVEGQSGLDKCGLLDFQDALIGPFAYDVMSLLEDARRSMDETMFDYLLYTKYLPSIKGLDQQAFLKSFYILAAQRHAKVLGIFVRLFKRDEKERYLGFLPHVHGLFVRALQQNELKPLVAWFEKHKIDIEQIPDVDRIKGVRQWA